MEPKYFAFPFGDEGHPKPSSSWRSVMGSRGIYISAQIGVPFKATISLYIVGIGYLGKAHCATSSTTNAWYAYSTWRENDGTNPTSSLIWFKKNWSLNNMMLIHMSLAETYHLKCQLVNHQSFFSTHPPVSQINPNRSRDQISHRMFIFLIILHVFCLRGKKCFNPQ